MGPQNCGRYGQVVVGSGLKRQTIFQGFPRYLQGMSSLNRGTANIKSNNRTYIKG